MIISIVTGFAAGAVHVLGGADHLLAVAPGVLHQPKMALKNGLLWGLGHSTGVVILSTLAIFLKDFAKIEHVSNLAELSVGIFLLIIGVLTMRTALGLNIHTHDHKHINGDKHQHFHFHLRGRERHNRHSHTSTSLGLLHGIAGASHLLAVIPALALPPLGAISYLTFYLFGSIFAMATIISIMSLATLRVGKRIMPMVFGFTGALSCVTGFFWIQKTSRFIV